MRKTRLKGSVVTATRATGPEEERGMAVLTINAERNILEVFYAPTAEEAGAEAKAYFDRLILSHPLQAIMKQLRQNLKGQGL